MCVKDVLKKLTILNLKKLTVNMNRRSNYNLLYDSNKRNGITHNFTVKIN